MVKAQIYSPISVGNKWFYKTGDQSFSDEITDHSYSYNGKTYYTSLRTYSWGDKDISHYRVDTDGTVIYLDSKSKLESIEIPGRNAKTGYTWISSDKAWKYTIAKIAATFKTPKQTFTDCLLIKAEQVTGRDKEKLQVYFNYYVVGIGFVGSETSDSVLTYIEKWNVR